MAEFADIIDQKRVTQHLQNALKTEKVSHAYILEGEKKAGKKFIAGIFAKTLLCANRQEINGLIEACGECHSCIQCDNNDNPDLKVIIHEKPGSIGVDEIRTQICDDVYIKPYASPYKIYIVPDGEKMTIQAQNALLKTLEEPPEYVVIIILTENSKAFLPTIISRCIVLEMKPASDELIKTHLMQELKVVDYRADFCVAFSRGNVGKAISLAADEGFEAYKNQVILLIKNIKTIEIHEVVSRIQEIVPAGDVEKRDEFLDLLTMLFRDVLVYKATEQTDNLIYSDSISYIKDIAKDCSFEKLGSIVNEIKITRRRIDNNVNSDVAIEILLLNIKENI